MTDWDIQPRSSACSACQQPFGEKQAYHTLLGVGAEGYTRRDLCGACIANATRDGVISYWQGEYKLPSPPPSEAIQKETAETLLRKLVESTDPDQGAARYILAVMLERKRILKHRDTVTDANGLDVLIYEHAQSGESFTVPDPHLRLDQLEEVQQRVAELLQPQKKAEAEPVVDSAPADSAS
jgi:hypothetical protein